tara:strand:+ start:2791 stop:3183 length:393 start_codon:yes stop_codon:yes gene_type:complete
MSHIIKSKPELLLTKIVTLRNLCYRNKQKIPNDNILQDEELQNHLQVSDKIMKNMLKDLEVKLKEEDNVDDKRLLQRIRENVTVFEKEIFGTQTLISEQENRTTIDSLTTHVDAVINRMQYKDGGDCVMM